MSQVLGDGQLAAASATVLGAAAGERVVALSLFNTSGAATQTVTLTVAKGTGTARTIGRYTLDPYESAYLNGLILDPADVLAGYASSASAVDYRVTAGTGDFEVMLRDADGAPKGTTAIVDQVFQLLEP